MAVGAVHLGWPGRRAVPSPWARARRGRSARRLGPTWVGPLAGSAQRGHGLRPAFPWAARVLHRLAALVLWNWAAVDSTQWHLIYIFIFSKYIQILANSKICVGFI
jgi:hypothetical protein